MRMILPPVASDLTLHRVGRHEAAGERALVVAHPRAEREVDLGRPVGLYGLAPSNLGKQGDY